MILHPFSEFISNNTHTFRELLPNRSKHIFRVHIKQYWHFQGVTPKQYYTLFQTSKSTDLSRELRQTILYTFPELTSNKTDFFKELLINNTTHFSRVYIKLLANNTAHISFHQTILTFSESYWQTILQTLPDFISLSNNTDIFKEPLPNNIDLFRAYFRQ